MLPSRARINLLATRIWNVAFQHNQPSYFGRSFISGKKNLVCGSGRNVQYVQCSSDAIEHHALDDAGTVIERQIGGNISKRDKTKILLNVLSSLKESKKAVYGALDAWVAWEQNFPVVSLRRTLVLLEKQHQWHRIIQVIKWMLSKGQGTTMGTYEQLIRALDKDDRAKEAHIFWEKRLGHDLHSVPWQLCELMISIYYRNNMLEHGVKLFKGLEAFGRKPPNKPIVGKIADSYELLGLFDEKKKVLEKYDYLLSESSKVSSRKQRKLYTGKGKRGEQGEGSKVSLV